MTTFETVRWCFSLALAALSGAAWLPIAASADPTKTVNVDCAMGQTIGQALQRDNERKPLLVVVKGVCNETVVILRDDVTLQADPVVGGGVNGPDPGSNTITVTASRVSIDGLTVTGGRNGITGQGASRLTIVNCVVQSGRTGISFFHGANGTVDHCTLQGNPLDGMVIESASATIINSLITQNARVGVLVTDGGAARIGVNNRNEAAGNTISGNGSNGIHISLGSTAFVAANAVSGNGTNPTAALGRFGVLVVNATADLIGSNSITDNANHGIFVRSATLLLGDANFGIPTLNTISGNGTALPSAGVFAFLGSSLAVRNATISANNGFGVVLSLRSSAQISGNTIQNNTGTPPSSGDGVRLVFGSGLFIEGPPAPANTVTGNTGFGLNCTDGESSVVNTSFLVLSANGLGSVSGACTGF